MNPTIAYYKNGNKHYEEYYNDLDKYHNESGPAFISYFKNGNKFCERYYINGKCHNIHGCAFIKYHSSGIIEYKEYWLNHIFINIKTDEEFQKYIKRLSIS